MASEALAESSLHHSSHPRQNELDPHGPRFYAAGVCRCIHEQVGQSQLALRWP